MSFFELSKNHVSINHRFSTYLSEQKTLYITHSLRTFAVSLIGIFLPLYIYRITANNEVFTQNHLMNGISWVVTYFLIRSVSCLISTVALIKILFKKLKFNRSIALSLLLLILEIVFLLNAEKSISFLLLASFISGITLTTYFIPYHIFFVKKFNDKDGKFGKASSFRHFLVIISQALGPIIGGTIITYYGFDILFTSSIVVLVIAAIPIMTSMKEWEHKDHNIASIIKEFLLNKKLRGVTISIGSQGVENVLYTVFWPLALFLSLENFTKIGSINSLSLVLSAVTTLIVGKYIDKFGSQFIHLAGCVLNAMLYILRVFVNAPFSLYAIDIADRINAPLFSIPNMSLIYEKSQKYNQSDFMIYRELIMHIAIVIICAILLLIFAFGGLLEWKWVFFITAIASLLVYAVDTE